MPDNLRPVISCGLCYKDPRAALEWLEKAFGFETTMVVENPDGSIGHSELRVGETALSWSATSGTHFIKARPA